MNPLRQISTRVTRQSRPIPGSGQVPNSAGGYAFPVDDWVRLRRFLVLGVDGGSYYATPRALARENADVVLRCLALDGQRVVREIVEVSVAGRNPKQQPVLFALAVCAGAEDPDVRAAALAAVPAVCRTATQLFGFVGFAEQFRGWGRGLRRAVAGWYVDRGADALALQLMKYQQREGWSHRDVLRLAKPAPERGTSTDLALRWAVGKLEDPAPAGTPALITAHRDVQAGGDVLAGVRAGLPWEGLPSEALASPEVWRALLPTMGLGALVRNVGRLTANGALAPGSRELEVVAARLGDAEALRRARLHPLSVLAALVTYRTGRGARGSLQWEPLGEVVDALDAAFYGSFGAVEAAGKRTVLALDVSGSMAGSFVAGVPGLTPRVASAAMAMVTLATEPTVHPVAFTSGSARADIGRSEISRLPITSRQRLDDVVKAVSDLPFGGTDCALPMLWALDKGVDVDTFVVLTDSETWAGTVHPAQALQRYRERTGIPARLIVVGMVSNGFSLADPRDGGMLDVVGFDTAAPQAMADFSAGRL